LATHIQGIGVRSTRYQLNDAFPYQNIAFNLHIVVRSGQVCRYLVVEALLTSIYLVPEEKKTFIYTRPTKLAAQGHLATWDLLS
jgi:hypothetical protein